MKRILFTGLALSLVLAAAPAEGAVKKVNAATNAVKWDDVDVNNSEHYALCTVYVLDWLDDPYVLLWCIGDEGYGKAWVRVKVPGVKGKVRRVRVETTGDCRGMDVRWRKRRSRVLVNLSVSAESNCKVRTVRIRYGA